MDDPDSYSDQASSEQSLASDKFRQLASELAWFRYELRKFLRFSEEAARQYGITPQQHQLLLGIAGFTGTGSATVSELADFLQERHNSVVGLVDRAVERGLVRRGQDDEDHRRVVVYLTPLGNEILCNLVRTHQQEIWRVKSDFLSPHAIDSRLTKIANSGKEETAPLR